MGAVKFATRMSKKFGDFVTFLWPSQNIHSVANVYAVLPFYNVKCLCSGAGGQE